MKQNKQIPDDLLIRYLLGEAAAADQLAAEQWISASKDNKIEFERLRLIWDQSRRPEPAQPIDEQQAWNNFMILAAGGGKKTVPLRRPSGWLKAAAAILVLAGGCLAVWMATNNQRNSPYASHQSGMAAPVTKIEPAATTSAEVSTSPVKDSGVQHVVVAAAATKSPEPSAKHEKWLASVKKTGKSSKHLITKTSGGPSKINGFICNDTPYPFEICIVQSVKCRNNGRSEVSTCSVLEPDQSGKLKYKAYDKIARHCKTSIEEIRITKISTGETIVLNDHSTPSTAKEFFNHITGKKKGDVFAGMFHSDNNCGLTFDSNFGNLTLQ